MHALILAAALGLTGSPETAPQSSSDPAAQKTSAPEGATVLDSGAWTLRVGGEAVAELEQREGDEGPLFSAGVVKTDTKLPVGYPAPTPPGAIELKHYPSLRRAEFTSESRPGAMGQNGFWPLFRHIQRNDIAMTAPVEMEYSDTDEDARADRWTMAFLYHSTENGPTGVDGRVTIVDTEPKTFLAMGVRGREPGWSGIGAIADRLDAWLAENPGWERTGMPRTLGYNGPNIPAGDQWWEVQVPVARVDHSENP